MRSLAFYQHWLDVVSRSFALCIPQLDAPFRDHVALAYLLFRVLDTVEDAPFATGDPGSASSSGSARSCARCPRRPRSMRSSPGSRSA